MKNIQIKYTFNALGYILFPFLVTVSIFLIFTRKQDFWQIVPIYGDMMLYQQITSFSLNGMAILIGGVWAILLLKKPWRAIFLAAILILVWNTVLETSITYSNTPDVKDLIGSAVGLIFYGFMLWIIAMYGFIRLQKNTAN